MFRLIKLLVWTGCAVALGAWMATTQVAGATPIEWISRAWRKAPVDQLEERVQDAKDALSSAHDHQVRERHSDQDKEAVNKLIAKRTGAK
jgi:hypothetical protein